MATNRKRHMLTPDEVAEAQQQIIALGIQPDGTRRRPDAPIGTCSECGRSIYAGPLGPEHDRFSLDRDHAAKAGA